jgi:hypothetical protein
MERGKLKARWSDVAKQLALRERQKSKNALAGVFRLGGRLFGRHGKIVVR